GFESGDGGEVAGFAAEEFHDLDGGAEAGERIDLEDVERLDAAQAAVGVFLEEGFEHGAGLVAVVGEDVAFFHAVGALAAGERRLVVGDVADEVEGVEVGADLRGEFVEEDALGGELLDDGELAVGVVPRGEEGVERGVGAEHGLAGVVGERLGDEFAVGIEVLHALGGDGDGDIADDVAAGLGVARRVSAGVGSKIRTGIDLGVIGTRAFIDVGWFAVVGLIVGRGHGVVALGFVDLDGVTVEVGVGEERCGALEVHDGEVEFAVVLVDAGAATDDLLELGHGGDATVEHDELTGLRIDARGHELGGGGDDRVGGLGVDEVVELGLAHVVVAGDAHDVFGVGGGEVGVGVDEGLSHAFGVVDIFAEDDGLGEAVGGLQELGDLGGDGGGALFEDEAAVVVEVVVFAVLDLVAVLVEFALLGTPAVEVFVEADADDFVGCEKPVLNALLERVGVDRIAEIVGVGNVLGFLGRGGEADLGGGGKVFEDLAPGGVVGRAAAVALVHHDEVEEIG